MTKTGSVLSLVRLLPASIDRVYAPCTQPELIATWLACSEAAQVCVEVDLRLGGRYRLTMCRAGERIGAAEGVYLAIEPPGRLAFTWRAAEVGVHNSVVTIELSAVGNGQTELRLTHDLDPDTTCGTRHAQGWQSALGRLRHQMERQAMTGAKTPPLSRGSTAQDIVRAYHHAWTRKGFAAAAAQLAPLLRVEVPVNHYPTKGSFVAALEGFGRMVTRVELLAELASDHEAMLYDLDVPVIGTLRVAEHFTVEEGKITRLRQIHDTVAIRAAGLASPD
jgi:uncharacterized protein YndB with AHSA1/START domain/limonene-1,2-epoxide hydrolase